MFFTEIAAFSMKEKTDSPKHKKATKPRNPFGVLFSSRRNQIIIGAIAALVLARGVLFPPQNTFSKEEKIEVQEVKPKEQREKDKKRMDEKYKPIGSDIRKEPQPTVRQEEGVAQNETKEENATHNKNRMLLSVIGGKEISLKLFRDKPTIKIGGLLVKEGTAIGEGFVSRNFRINSGVSKIEDIEFMFDIESEGKTIRTIKKRVGDFYKIIYYEGAIEVVEKDTEDSTGIILENEKLTSLFYIKGIKETKKDIVFKMALFKGEEREYRVPMRDIQ